MKLVYSPQAVADMRAALAWWKANRDKAPGLLRTELNEARAVLRRAADAGAPAGSPGRENVRRLLLRRTRYFIYYEVDVAARVVKVLRMWHMSRGSAPLP